MAKVNEHAFELWKRHVCQPRMDSELVALQLLCDTHPGYHITRTEPGTCDLIGYAEAGHATKTLDLVAGYDATRNYKSSGTSTCSIPDCSLPGCLLLDVSPGTLQDEIRFGCWRYSWNEHELMVYEIGYFDLYNTLVKQLYVLAPTGDEVQNGFHKHTDALILAAGAWTKALHEQIYVFDNSTWEKSSSMFRSVQGVSWDDLIQEPAVKDSLLKDVLSFFKSRESYASMEVPWKRGIILHGVPGNGKTLSIKALINSLSTLDPPIPALVVKSFDNECSGPKWAMKDVFSQARAMAPCVLIFEDLDSLVENETRSYFLNEVDGIETNDGILMIGSTNHLGKLDDAITKRPSRFDRKFHFKLPEEPERVAYCRQWANRFADKGTVDFPDELCDVIAKLTDGFSFAYLKELFISSLLTLSHGQITHGNNTDVNNIDVNGADTHNADADNSSANGIAANDASVDNTDANTPDAKGTDADNGADDADTPGVDVTKDEDMATGKNDTRAEKSAEEDKKGEETPAKAKRVMPTVQTPDHLKNNMLLRIVRKEAKVLWDQMDNSVEED
ncbi:proteasome-activating nucleotidase [Pochonia chlamydosporia 170]|uniref:Proteasome-activating nucleotidase n=1 Tax=Pochonia chlamydosporia 170 TaxID=1380566 RepID=A0A179EVM7_METCM|nr:proteasome-activating nucleotidase [Pochonia chlamydosporia 170]OAQ57251.1 proteasome-activating nucleotidase [Pochonia chlamydosporia 170]